jgi:uncharacterized membrane protein
MELQALRPGRALAAAVFVAATLVLSVQLITPSPVMVSVGDGAATTSALGEYFPYEDAGIVALAACLAGASGTYLVTAGSGEREDGTAAGTAARARRPAADGEGSGTDDDLTPSEDLLEARRAEWEETAERLANNEREVYEAVLDADGVLPQSEVVAETDLSKATVSRALDSLETKDLVERKRRGMGNVVLLL